jgi:PKD repeat protein
MIGSHRQSSKGKDRPQAQRHVGRSRRRRKVLWSGSGLALLATGLLIAQLVWAAPPTANFTISDATPNTGQSVTFNSTSSDPDNDIATIEWDFDYDGSFNAGATGDTVSHTYNSPGARSVALRVTDTAGDPNAGGDGDATSVLSVKTVTVSTPNQPPVASNITFTPAVPDVGQALAVSGTGSDPDGDPITYEWNFGDGGTATGQNASHTYSTPGSKNVTLTVRDNRGGTDTHQESVRVNALPVAVAAILNASAESGQRNDTPLVGQDYALTGGQNLSGPGSSDAEGALTYAWDLDNNGSFETANQSVPATAALKTAGQKTVRLRVTDTDGATDDATLTYRVNRAPVPGFIVEPATPIVGQTVQYSSTSSDPDGTSDPLTYAWDLDGDGAFDDATSHNPTAQYTAAGTRQVRLRVTDTGGISRVTQPRNVLIQLSAPNAGFSFGPGAPLPGQAVAFRSSATPSAGKSIQKVEWDFNYNQSTGAFTPDASGSSVNRSFPTAGPKLVAIRATETGGGFDIATRTVIVNAPPRASLAQSATSIFVDDTVTLSSTSSDPDGPLVRQEWDLDGDGAFDDARAAVVSATYRRRGNHAIALRVTDSKGATSIATGSLQVRRRPLLALDGVQIGIRGRLSGSDTVVTRLRVRAPKKAMIRVRCVGQGCPKAMRKRSKGRRLRFRRFEREFKPGVRLVVTVSRKGFLGRRTSFKMKKGAEPVRRDGCVAPGARFAKRCPAE